MNARTSTASKSRLNYLNLVADGPEEWTVREPPHLAARGVINHLDCCLAFTCQAGAQPYQDLGAVDDGTVDGGGQRQRHHDRGRVVTSTNASRPKPVRPGRRNGDRGRLAAVEDMREVTLAKAGRQVVAAGPDRVQIIRRANAHAKRM
jgi:hypothetical protein